MLKNLQYIDSLIQQIEDKPLRNEIILVLFDLVLELGKEELQEYFNQVWLEPETTLTLAE